MYLDVSFEIMKNFLDNDFQLNFVCLLVLDDATQFAASFVFFYNLYDSVVILSCFGKFNYLVLFSDLTGSWSSEKNL